MLDLPVERPLHCGGAGTPKANGTAGDRLQTGDVIIDVNGKAVSSPADVREAVSNAQSGGRKSVLRRVKSAQGMRFVAVPLSNA
jgi:serine protease Do